MGRGARPALPATSDRLRMDVPSLCRKTPFWRYMWYIELGCPAVDVVSETAMWIVFHPVVTNFG